MTLKILLAWTVLTAAAVGILLLAGTALVTFFGWWGVIGIPAFGGLVALLIWAIETAASR